MVRVENVSFEIKGKKLVKEVSGAFEKGKMTLILGPNGAGKSTLVKLISNELRPTTGSILYEGKPIQKSSLQEQARYRAVLSQNLELSFPLDVEEVVRMGRYPHFEGKPSANDLEVCKKAMELFDLLDLKNRNYLTLSGGEKQRVQFARIFAQIWEPVEGKSRLLLLDEPLTFLDIYYQYDLMNKIQGFMQANPDLTVIGVVHDLNIAQKYADRIMLVKKSEVFAFGNTKEVLTPENIYTVFRVKIENSLQFGL